MEIRNARDAAGRLDNDEKGVAIADTLGGPQSVAIINESGLWSLVLTSRKPEALAFKRWLTSEVIPTIRRTGSYQASETPEQTLAKAVLIANDRITQQQAQLEAAATQINALKPAAEAFMELTDSTGRLPSLRTFFRPFEEINLIAIPRVLADLGYLYKSPDWENNYRIKRSHPESPYYFAEKLTNPDGHYPGWSGCTILLKPAGQVKMAELYSAGVFPKLKRFQLAH